MTRHLPLCLALSILSVSSDTVAAASEALAIKAGLWQKSITIAQAGQTLDTPMRVEVCYTTEMLALDRLKAMLADRTCQWTRQDLTPTRLEVAYRCAKMRVESTIEVDDPEHVRVSSTTLMSVDGQEQQTTAHESWQFLRASCDSH